MVNVWLIVKYTILNRCKYIHIINNSKLFNKLFLYIRFANI